MSKEKETKKEEPKLKVCQCGNPTVTQELPVGFKGTLKCGTPGCNGYFTYPLANMEYKGSDPVEGFLFALSRTSKEMTFEKATLIMLRRIEEAFLGRKK